MLAQSSDKKASYKSLLDCPFRKALCTEKRMIALEVTLKRGIPANLFCVLTTFLEPCVPNLDHVRQRTSLDLFDKNRYDCQPSREIDS